MTVGEAEQATKVEAPRGSRTVGRVSVIIPHFNDYDNLDACLTLLQAQSFPGNQTEIIVADNGSSLGLDTVRRIVGSRGKVIEVAERGAGPARNAGVGASRGDAIAFIDSDCRPDKCWLEEGLAELRQADFVGGRVDVLVENPRRMTAAEAFESVFAFRNEHYVKDLNFTVTASMFVWRSVFDAVGGFENGVPEDKDWCERAGRQGYRIRFSPNSIVGHPARKTLSELKRKWRRLTLERCEGAKRNGTRPVLILLREMAALLAVAPHALAPLASKRLSGSQARLKAIGVLAQIRAYRFWVASRAVLRPGDERIVAASHQSRSRALGPPD
jgi:GT2 family glycosyltransferase